MTDRLKMTANESLPATADEVRQLLKDFQKLRSTEDSEKEKEKEKVRTMAAEIMVFELKNKKDFGVPNIKELEQVGHLSLSLPLSLSPSLPLSLSLPQSFS